MGPWLGCSLSCPNRARAWISPTCRRPWPNSASSSARRSCWSGRRDCPTRRQRGSAAQISARSKAASIALVPGWPNCWTFALVRTLGRTGLLGPAFSSMPHRESRTGDPQDHWYGAERELSQTAHERSEATVEDASSALFREWHRLATRRCRGLTRRATATSASHRALHGRRRYCSRAWYDGVLLSGSP